MPLLFVSTTSFMVAMYSMDFKATRESLETAGYIYFVAGAFIISICNKQSAS